MKDAIISVGVFSFFINLLMLTGPLYMLQVYDRVLSSQSMSTLVSLSLLMGTLYIFVWLLESVRSKVLSRFANSVEEKLSERTFEASMRMGLGRSQSQASVPIRDLSTIRTFFASNAMATMFDMPWVPVYLGVIFLLHWTMGLFAVFGAAVIIACAVYAQILGKSPEQDERDSKIKGQAIEEQAARNAGMVKAMGMEGHLYNRWNTLNAEATTHATLGSDRVSGVRAFSKAFRLFLQSSILGIGAALAINQVVSPGSMIAGSIILGRALTPAQTLISQWPLIIAARASYQRLDDVHRALDSKPAHMNLPAPKGWLEVKNMAGGPPGSQSPIVMGLNFTLYPGDGLGIIGPSASGKSSLANFLVGIWIPQRGDVRLDGATFQQWHASQTHGGVGKYIGYLPQSIELFDGTIKENISRFDPHASEHQVLEAAYRAGVHELILTLPQGYGTIVGAGGAVLSGGQLQRIALARALYGDPCLVVLDEPNANLDDEGEAALSNAIKSIRERGNTVIVITHRIGAIKDMNKVLVLKQGQQAMFGDTRRVLGALNGKGGKSSRPASQATTNPSQNTSAPLLRPDATPRAHPLARQTHPSQLAQTETQNFAVMQPSKPLPHGLAPNPYPTALNVPRAQPLKRASGAS
ncbi:type I secretion system permease/ATPase [Algimonas arctica]|nr:type I secretion system permease/ATPase [Algimonas arctica]